MFPPAAHEAMGGSPSKQTFFWQRRKKSPLKRAWTQLKGALPNQKRRRKSVLSLDKLRLHNVRKGKNSKRRFSLSNKSEPTLLKRLSLGNIKKVSTEKLSPQRDKDRGGLGKVGELMKRKNSKDPGVTKDSAVDKISLKDGTKVSKLDNNMDSSTTVQQEPKKIGKLKMKKSKFNIKIQDSAHIPQENQTDTTVHSF